MDLRNNYDPVAAEYAKRLYHELDHKPRDRELLDQLAAQVGASEIICDLGCGPGQVAAYLHSRGARARYSSVGRDAQTRAAIEPGDYF